jgi:predicted RecB family nuclease
MREILWPALASCELPAGGQMSVTTNILEAFLSCRTKALLYVEGAGGNLSEWGEWRLRSRQSFAREVSQRLCHALTDDEWHLGVPSVGALKQGRYQLILQCKLGTSEMSSDIDALQIDPPTRQAKVGGYIPIRFALNEKLTKTDKLLLAFDAFILYRVLGEMPEVGRIIHGSNYKTVTVKLAGLVPEIPSILRSLKEAQANATPMPIVLNRHCGQCEFQSQCRQVAVEKDDLSLLANMSAKERQSHNNKGIFTVTQLSYAFRPRKRSSSLPQKHHTALKALAIRKKQIHVLGTPPTLSQGTPVYLDVEGDPDRDFYYLIGLRYSRKGADEHHSFWADTRSGERDMWSECLRTLALIRNPRIIHYGSYEVQFLKRMRNRYPDLVGSYSLVDELISTSLNLLSITYAYVYFPTCSNRLKDIAGCLGFEWSFRAASGLTTIAWRSRWECTGDPELKRQLLTTMPRIVRRYSAWLKRSLQSHRRTILSTRRMKR